MLKTRDMHKLLRILSLTAFLLVSGCATGPSAVTEPEPNRLSNTYLQLGIEYMRQGENEIALAKLEKALSIDPNSANVHNTLGVLYNRLGKTDEAEKHFKKAVKLAPSDARSLNNYGQFLCQNGRETEGVPLFLKATENPLYPTPETAYANAGICELKIDHTQAAESHFRSALERNPTLAMALFHMAKISYDQKKYLPARGYLQRYMENASHTPQSLWLGIQIERELDDKDAVASYSLALKNQYPD